MRIVINIPEEVREHILDLANDGNKTPLGINAHMINAIVNGTSIPDNATNGDVLYKLFPNLTYGTNREHYHVWSNDGKCTMNIHQDFWNAPYQKG